MIESNSSELDVLAQTKRAGLTMHQRRKLLEAGIMFVFLIYAFVTLFPFFVLFVRTFVSTKDATELHLWIPEAEEVNLDAQIGNLSVFYDLDLAVFKDDLGIPATVYLAPRTTLREVAAENGISEEEMKEYFAPFSIYNGWIVMFGNNVYWMALLRTTAITVVSIIGLIVLSTATGYGLAGLARKDQVLWFNLYLLRAVIPPMLIILPQFMIIQWLFNLVPGYEEGGTVRTLAQLTSVVLIWVRGGAVPALIMTAAIERLPKELEEAAEVDGANPLQYFFYILLPLMKVPMASLAVIFLPLVWNDFIHPYVYLDSANTTVLPLIQTFSGQFSSNFQVIYTGIFVSVLPLIVIYILFRKWFVQGALAGAVKG